jgi:hypothetical protein
MTSWDSYTSRELEALLGSPTMSNTHQATHCKVDGSFLERTSPTLCRDILRLESKVDSVTSHILSTSTQSQAGGSISASLSPSPFPVPPPPPISGYSPVSVSTPNQTLPLNNHEALSFLNLYCAEMAPLFPFVAIPPDITPHHLRHEKPVLYMSIMMAVSRPSIRSHHRGLSPVRKSLLERFHGMLSDLY